MPAFLTTGLAEVISFVPKLLLALVILIVGLIIASLISRALSRLLHRVGFDRVVERGGIKKALASSKLDPSDIIAKIVYYALVLFVLQFTFGVFGPNSVSVLLATIIGYLPQVIVAIIIVIVAAALAAGAKTLIEGTLGGLSYGKLLANLASIGIVFLGIVAALNQLGIAFTVTTPVLIAVLAAIVGVVVVGVGGGLIKPMQSRWESYLARLEAEAPNARAAAQNAPSVGEQARAAVNRVQDQAAPGSTGTTAETSTTGATVITPRTLNDGSAR